MATATSPRPMVHHAPVVPLPYPDTERPSSGLDAPQRRSTPDTRGLEELSPERLGTLLRDLRTSSGDPLPTIAKKLSWHFTPTVLRMIEGGEYPLSPHDLARVLDGYGTNEASLTRSRDKLEIDMASGRMASGGHEWRLERRDKTYAILLDYVRFVREMRNLSPGSTLPTSSLRQEDLSALADSLRADSHAIEAAVKAIISPHAVTSEEITLIAQTCEVERSAVEKYFSGLLGDGHEMQDRGTNTDAMDTVSPVVVLHTENAANGSGVPTDVDQGPFHDGEPDDDPEAQDHIKVFGRRKASLLHRVVS